MRTIAAAVALLLACASGEYAGSEECDPGSSGLLPAAGCCTHDGLCVYPPSYQAECRAFRRSECGSAEYPPRFEGQESWVACPSLDPDATFTPCPLSWLLTE